MKRTAKIAAIVLTAALMSSCTGTPVEVPPATVGKVSGSGGLQDGIIPPSKIRLEGMCWVCDTLILAEANDYGISEKMTIFMPKDKLNLDVQVRGTVSISSSEENMNKIFERMTAEKINSKVSLIRLSDVYATYGKTIIEQTSRAVISKYSITEVMGNVDSVSNEVHSELSKRLSTTPLKLIQFGLNDLQPPPVIVQAQITKSEREIAIEQTEAEKLIKLKQAEAALEVAIKQQEVDLKEAETQVLVDKRLAEGVSEAWMAQRAIKALEKLQNGNHIILMPTEAFTDPAMMIGAATKAFGKVGTQ